MKIRSKDILMPIIVGVLFLFLYYFLPKIHLFLWLIFMYSYGVWFSVVIVKLIEHYIGNKFGSSGVIFIIIGVLLYLVTLLYLSKNVEFIVHYRRITFLPFNGIIYLMILSIVLKMAIKYYDYLLVFIYGIILNISFTDSNNMFFRLDILIAIWISCFLMHVIQISKRNIPLGTRM